MSSSTSLSGYWAGVCKLPAEVDGASLLTTDVGVGAPPELEAGVCVAEIVAAMDCVGPTAMDYVGPTAIDCVGPTAIDCVGPTKTDCVGPTTADCVGPTTADCVGPTTADCVGPTTADCVGPTTADCVGATAVVGAVDVSERCSRLTLSKYFLFLVCAMPLPL